MDMPGSKIVFIDDNDEALSVQILSMIMAEALLEQVKLHNTNNRKNNVLTKES